MTLRTTTSQAGSNHRLLYVLTVYISAQGQSDTRGGDQHVPTSSKGGRDHLHSLAEDTLMSGCLPARVSVWVSVWGECVGVWVCMRVCVCVCVCRLAEISTVFVVACQLTIQNKLTVYSATRTVGRVADENAHDVVSL